MNDIRDWAADAMYPEAEAIYGAHTATDAKRMLEISTVLCLSLHNVRDLHDNMQTNAPPQLSMRVAYSAHILKTFYATLNKRLEVCCRYGDAVL